MVWTHVPPEARAPAEIDPFAIAIEDKVERLLAANSAAMGVQGVCAARAQRRGRGRRVPDVVGRLRV
jgi:hypothetical protein